MARRPFIRSKFWIVLAVALCISFIPIFLLVNKKSLDALRNIPAGIVICLSGIMVISWFFEGFRLHTILKVSRIPFSLAKAMSLTMAAEFAGAATPGAAGQGLAYILFIYRHGNSLGYASGVLVLISLLDLLVIGMMILASICLWPFTARVTSFDNTFLYGFLFISIILLLVVLAHRYSDALENTTDRLLRNIKWYRRHQERVKLFFTNLMTAITLIRRISWKTRLSLLGSTMGYWLPRYTILWVIFDYIHASIGGPFLILSQTLLNMISQLNFLPGGAGSVGATFLLLFHGKMPKYYIGYSFVIWRFFSYYWYLIIGAPWFFLQLNSMFFTHQTETLPGNLHRQP